ncbi:MAG: DMT family transporter [Gaiellaceae bacterium]
MSAGNALAVALTVAGGVAGAVQAAVMGRFGERIGTIEALAFATLGTALISGALLLVARQGFGGYAAAARQPPWLWTGSVMGAVIVLAITFAAPRIGTTATIGIITAGNLVTGALVDRFGLFGLERIPLHWTRVFGILLLGLGAALVLRK